MATADEIQDKHSAQWVASRRVQWDARVELLSRHRAEKAELLRQQAEDRRALSGQQKAEWRARKAAEAKRRKDKTARIIAGLERWSPD